MDRIELRDFLNAHFNESELRNLTFELKVDYESLPGNGKSDKAREIVTHFERRGEIVGLTKAIRQARPNLKLPAQLFISYKRNSDTDRALANYLHQSLTADGHSAFIDTTMRAGAAWLDEIDQRIQASDFLVVLLSHDSIDSEMVRAEIARAAEFRKLQGRPQILPVRMAFDGLLPYAISAFLNPLQYVVWEKEDDNEHVYRDILTAIKDELPDQAPHRFTSASGTQIVSDDGRIVKDGQASQSELHPPLPEFDPRFVEELETPGGTVKLSDALYIARSADDKLKREASKSGTTTIIRAARQTGKSSLLIRGLQHARDKGAKIISLDLQRVDDSRLNSPDTLLHDLADHIVRKLRLELDVGRHWQNALPPQEKLTSLMEESVLPASNAPIVFALDEADRFLGKPMSKDFFGLMRSWHNNRAASGDWNKLNIVLVISTEPYLLINDISQSPFNVGMTLPLEDFTAAQIADLNRRHGSPLRGQDMPQMMDLLSGHPYLTRKAFYTLVTDKITWADLMRVAADDQGPFADHLRHHYWLLRNGQGLPDTLKQVIRENRCKDDQAFFRLLQAGLVKGSGDVRKCRCGLYEIYFKDRL